MLNTTVCVVNFKIKTHIKSYSKEGDKNLIKNLELQLKDQEYSVYSRACPLSEARFLEVFLDSDLLNFNFMEVKYFE